MTNTTVLLRESILSAGMTLTETDSQDIYQDYDNNSLATAVIGAIKHICIAVRTVRILSQSC